ncbi:unnamed protein product [Menidia menidia]|uniref:(Atlantic silverside) hypothetical protein n=1 Tax=Menidia menidia TaxID=238744 RepID=A0A8S4AST2_9TELE|nr:unnamed protein product [Menidia menidia]
MSRTPDARARDNQTRRIQENITGVEKHFGEMCQLFAAYVRKTARLRDKADLLVREIGVYADTETPDLKRGMKQFADHLAKTRRIQENITGVEKHFGEMCQLFAAYVRKTARLRDKADLLVREIGVYADTETPDLKRGMKQFADHLAKEDLRTTQIARDKEAKQMAQLEKTRLRNPSDRQIIAESELQRATMDATRTTKQLEETIDEFERQKIQDIKKILGEFVTVEMSFHAKALEVYTLAFQSIQSVDEEADLEVFRSSLHPPDYQSRLDIVRANSKTSLDRTGSFLSTSGTLQRKP